MKKYLPIMLLSMVILSSCGGAQNSDYAPLDPSKDNLVNRKMWSYNVENSKLESSETKVLFKAGSDIPYMSLKGGAEVINAIKKARNKNASLTYSKSGKKVTYNSHVNGSIVDAKIEFNSDTQKITFSDIDAFFRVDSKIKPLTPYEIKEGVKSIKISEKAQEYKQGKQIEIDLNKYDLIDIYQYGDDLYLPVQTFSDFLLSIDSSINIAYNLKDLFLITTASPLEEEIFGLKDLSKIGEKFYKTAPKNTTISENYTKFNYQSMCLNLDYSYGLKDNKNIKSFDEFFSSHSLRTEATKSYKSELLSNDAHRIDNALAYALSDLVDGHTALNLTSPLYDYGDGNADSKNINPDMVNFTKGSENLAKDQIGKGIKQGFKISESRPDTAFITFTSFSDIDEINLYLDDELKSEDYNPYINTQTLFAESYKQITANKDIKNVVVDITNNDGGAISTVIYALCTLLGEIHINMKDQLSGATNTTYYKADINADQKIDEKDKGLAELGYNIFILTSEYSFSSANAMPVFAKECNSKVSIVGQKTAGGPCAVRSTITPLGATYSQSGISALAVKNKGTYQDIDNGIKPDYIETYENMYSRDYLATQLDNYIIK